MTNSYELLYIIDSTATEEAREALIEKVQNLIVKSNGVVDNVEKIGMKKLAYPINDREDGFYVLVNFTAEPSVPNELERQLAITDNFVRCLIIKK